MLHCIDLFFLVNICGGDTEPAAANGPEPDVSSEEEEVVCGPMTLSAYRAWQAELRTLTPALPPQPDGSAHEAPMDPAPVPAPLAADAPAIEPETADEDGGSL